MKYSYLNFIKNKQWKRLIVNIVFSNWVQEINILLDSVIKLQEIKQCVEQRSGKLSWGSHELINNKPKNFQMYIFEKKKNSKTTT